MASTLNTLTLPPQHEQSHVRPLVLLHGYGANAQDLIGLRDAVAPDRVAIAIEAPIDLGPMGMPGGYAWFHIHPTPTGDLQYDLAGAMDAAARLQQDIPSAVQAAGGHMQDSVILGFSQGAMLGHAMLLQAGLSMQGLAACSGRMVPELFHMTPDQQIDIPVFLSHGTLDEIIPYRSGEEIAAFYQAQTAADVTWCPEQIGHGIGPAMLQSLQEWFSALAAPRAST
ncbi:MAG: hypothetical protein MK077_02995 [Phycisphaerales bacterium]|nr:hypothetical protein [Phycisphaerales bacterium]